jgi:hypothetical protein
MGLLDILRQYADPAGVQPDRVQDHFAEVAQQSAPQDLGSSLAAAFRSSATPPFGQMVGELFGNSNPQQQAGVLNQLVQGIAPGALSSVAGGVLGRILGAGAAAGVPPVITAEQAAQVSPADVGAIATHAEKHDGSIVDQVGAFYAQHPALVQGLGTAALALVMSHMSASR